MRVEKYPNASGAVRQYTTFSIPGRNGSLHFDQGAFKNYTQVYDLYFHAEGAVNEDAHEVKAWLLGEPGYQRLTDAYDTTHYRMAIVSGDIDISNHFNKYGRLRVSFDCDPRSFLISGDTAVTFNSSGAIENHTLFDALPVIAVYGSGAGNVTINGSVVEIKSMPASKPLYLDCENENAYSVSGGAKVNENKNIYAPSFPVLSPGRNTVSFTGSVSSVKITPRWWEL